MEPGLDSLQGSFWQSVQVDDPEGNEVGHWHLVFEGRREIEKRKNANLRLRLPKIVVPPSFEGRQILELLEAERARTDHAFGDTAKFLQVDASAKRFHDFRDIRHVQGLDTWKLHRKRVHALGEMCVLSDGTSPRLCSPHLW
jgi:hypothetical protein